MKVQNFITKDSNITHILEKKNSIKSQKICQPRNPRKQEPIPITPLKKILKYIYIKKINPSMRVEIVLEEEWKAKLFEKYLN